jgi:hypothetical protein
VFANRAFVILNFIKRSLLTTVYFPQLTTSFNAFRQRVLKLSQSASEAGRRPYQCSSKSEVSGSSSV